MGFLNVIVNEDLYDRDFVDHWLLQHVGATQLPHPREPVTQRRAHQPSFDGVTRRVNKEDLTD